MAKKNNDSKSTRRAIVRHYLLQIAGNGETIVGVEVVVEPVPIQIPALTVLIQVRDVPVAVVVHRETCGKPSVPPSLEYSQD